jgi:DNA-binding CsgD family transcriptional regulator
MKTVLVGRSAELAEIDEIIDRARQGTSGVLVLVGEAGIGKSALLAAAAERAHGMRVLRAAGVESEITMPFAGLHQLIWPIVDRVDNLVLPQAKAIRGALGLGAEPGSLFLVGTALLTLLAEVAEDQPLLFLIDDAQWLDEPSAMALAFAARRLESEPLAGLLAVRDGESPIRQIPSLEIKGLETAAAQQLLAEAGGRIAPKVRERLIEEARGNPLALKELPSTLTKAQLAGKSALPPWLPLPERLANVYGKRARSLPGSTQQLLVLAAAGVDASLDIITIAAAKLGLATSALKPAERAQLISLDQGRLEFCHPLARLAIYQEASSLNRSASHQALAEASDRDRRIWHLAMATGGTDEGIASALESSAGRAERHQGASAAAAALERSAELSQDDDLRARRLAKAATSNLAGGWPDRAQVLLADAESITEDPRVEAEITFCRARLLMHTTTSTHADVDALLDGARLVEKSDPGFAADMLSLGSFIGCFQRDWSSVTEAAQRLLNLDLPADSPYRRQAQDIIGVLDSGGSLKGNYLGLPYDTVSQQLVPESLSPPSIVDLAGAEAEAHEFLQRAVRDMRTRGVLWVLIPITVGLAQNEYLLGLWSSSETHLSEALTLARQTGHELLAAAALAFLARLAAMRGESDRCRQLAQQGRSASGNCAMVEGLRAWALALLDLGSGRARQAHDRLTALAPAASWPDRNLTALRVSADMAEAAIRCGRLDEAALVLDGLERWAGSSPPAWVQVVLHRYRAMLAEDQMTAEAHFRAALSVPGGERRPWDHARAQLLYGAWLRRQRRKDEARIYLRAALDIFDRLGARPWSQQVCNEIRATGETFVREEFSELKQLTPQELQIARLAALGMTNREIGAQLFLSPRTVGTHLYRLFPKLGIASRADLRNLDLEGIKPLVAVS